ncbi:MAG: hypothetical protein Q7T32_06525 [Moraxellaceae bacterium]|nr:hypothetical protein [Moraxellaceae bacterium]
MMKYKNRGLRTALAVAIASATLAGCGSDSKEAASTPAAAATVEAAGGMTVKLQGGIGGNGAGNTGGYGNDFELYKEAGSGDLKVLKTGAANAAFTSKSFTPSFGEVKATVSANTTLSVLADCAATPPAADVLYQVVNNSNLYKSNGVTAACEAEEVVTGLDIKSGATLTLGINMTGWTDWAYVNIDADIRNNGKITVADYSPTKRGNIDLDSSSYIGSGKIETNGTLDGQSAGDIYVWADYAMINSGKMNATGADSSTAAAGNAGYIDLESGYYTQNTGNLTARGGNTTFAGAAGGDADYIELYSDWGPTFNSGAFDGRGGEGATGGDGADVYMYSYLGKLFNSGKISVYGANSTVGNGGNGGYVGFEAEGGQIRNSAGVLAWGGDTTDATGSGGNGDELYVYSDYGSLYEYTPAGDIYWSGQIDLSGGDAVATGTGNGGSAGDVYAEVYGSDVNLKSKLVFLGYSKVQTYGGEGNHGGSAGGYGLYNYDGYVYGDEYAPAPGGSVISQAALVANGGNARATGIDAQGNGGRGGYIYLETDYYPTAQLVPESQKVSQNGNVNIAGGTGRNQNSIYINYGGYSWIWGYNGASITGTFNSDGGDDLGTTTGTVGYGGYAPGLYVYSELGVAKVAGNVSSNGGDGNYAGGYSDGMYIYGNTVNVASTIKANGGNADATEVGSQGGNGGYIELKATRPQNSTVTGSATYAGGTGATKGSEGGYMRLISCAGAGC